MNYIVLKTTQFGRTQVTALKTPVENQILRIGYTANQQKYKDIYMSQTFQTLANVID